MLLLVVIFILFCQLRAFNIDEEILKFDMVHIKGSEIVNENLEHVVNFL